MADLGNAPPSVTGSTRADVVTTAVTAAFTLQFDRYSHFYRVLGANSLAITVAGVRKGSVGDWIVALEQDGTGTRLKPTFAASTNDAGDTLVFHTSGVGAGSAAWPTLTVTAGVVDTFRIFTFDGVNVFLATLGLNHDE